MLRCEEVVITVKLELLEKQKKDKPVGVQFSMVHVKMCKSIVYIISLIVLER